MFLNFAKQLRIVIIVIWFVKKKWVSIYIDGDGQ